MEGEFDGNGHCDWIMGRDRDLQAKHRVYAPAAFLIGQERAKSDINHRVTPQQFWNPPGPEMTVINLHAPAPVVAALREYGFHTGYDREPGSDLDNGLVKVFAETDATKHLWPLRQWISVIQWEAASDPRLICTIWHPSAEPALVQKASIWPVIELTATSVEEALRQLPPALRRPKMPDLLLEHRFPPGHRFQRPLPQPAPTWHGHPARGLGPVPLPQPPPAPSRPPIPTNALESTPHANCPKSKCIYLGLFLLLP